MSYHTIIQLTETLVDKLQMPDSATAFEESYGALEELLEETRDASYHRAADPSVRERFSSLHGQLDALARRLEPGDYHRQTWRTLQDLIDISERIAAASPDAPARSGPLLDLDEALGLLREEPDQLREQAAQELCADPESIIGAYLLGAAELCLGRHAEAIAAAEGLAIRYPARHVDTIAVAAAAMQGRAEWARDRALAGMHRRLEARRPQPWQRIPGLRTLNDDEAELIRQVNVYLVQRTLHWIQDARWSDARRFVLTGLLAPSLTQARYLLEQSEEEDEEDEEDDWVAAARCGLARCARWRCAFLEALEHIDGLDTPFAVAERALAARDRTLIESGELELFGYGVRLRLGRTVESTGFAFGDDELTMTEHEDRDEAQVADLLKDHAASWICTGFSLSIVQRGPLSDEDLDEDDEQPEPEAAFDVTRFFELYNREDMTGIGRYADAVISQHPHAPTPWAAKALVHLVEGEWDQASAASRQGALRSGCRALALPQVLMPLAEDDYGRALSLAMNNLSLRLRSATPETPILLPGYPHITRSEGELLDQIEHNTWRMAEELMSDLEPEAEEQVLELQLLAALIVPNPATTLEELEELLPDLEASLGLQAAACVALARWRRHEGAMEEAGNLLQRADRLVPGLTYTRTEQQKLARDRWLLSQEEVTLRGFGVTIELERSGRLLHRSFTPDRSRETHALTGWIEDSRPDAVPLALRDVAVSWLESGFSLLTDALGE
ncbi:MAG: hypothetical protein ACI8S6_000513 [Myxococcota bacterium]|jgi:hypothetical protein